ncbi:unnamed protein product [Bemisia tabaci]|uniref:Uncharacterized protein n=1 Tax=Bemisia tabaci TaxID=7038 RepID=A0A9P0F8S4_BEMTA|nr:unnamed protein product [Bemisia tabaci]
MSGDDALARIGGRQSRRIKMLSLLGILCLIKLGFTPTNAIHVFNRFSPEVLTNLGYGGHGSFRGQSYIQVEKILKEEKGVREGRGNCGENQQDQFSLVEKPFPPLILLPLYFSTYFLLHVAVASRHSTDVMAYLYFQITVHGKEELNTRRQCKTPSKYGTATKITLHAENKMAFSTTSAIVDESENNISYCFDARS